MQKDMILGGARLQIIAGQPHAGPTASTTELLFRIKMEHHLIRTGSINSWNGIQTTTLLWFLILLQGV